MINTSCMWHIFVIHKLVYQSAESSANLKSILALTQTAQSIKRCQAFYAFMSLHFRRQPHGKLSQGEGVTLENWESTHSVISRLIRSSLSDFAELPVINVVRSLSSNVGF